MDNLTKKQLNISISLFVFAIHCLMPSTGIRLYDTAVTLLQYATLIWPLLLVIQHPLARLKKLLPVILFWGIGLLSTLINGTDILALLKLTAFSLAACLVTAHLLMLEGFRGFRKIGWFFSGLMIAEFLSSLVGGLTTIVDGNGISVVNYFLGQQPTSNRIYLTAVTLLTLLFITGNKADRCCSAIGILAGTLFMFQRDVSTGKMTLYIFIGMLIITRFVRRKHFWQNVLIVLSVFVIVFNLSAGSFGSFSWLFEGILHEDLTLNGRTLLWSSAVSQMLSWHWLIGNGYGHQFIFSIGNWNVPTVHSQYLNILFCFGFLGLGGYFYMLFQQFKSIWVIHTPRIKRVLIASGVTALMTGIPTTTYQSIYIYVLFTVLVYFEKAVQGASHVS